ncbi:hypothetical protein vB_RpoS-V16_58 [Ruegeria phage vB_RpoS-V16]|uniref:hypothetical protein n=1 Tax=Ruegeria phage vB_RpoS-V16 TaxID=2218618 RepID=UPI000DCAACA6|nr:hypothetical protein JT311_gp58 [Ruegeria phage vB_RpoS-V16]AWY09494.1 hypothetical protein vB_RpoS-V16_58 [Ruegeria phage vB_RpoS-V16]
MKLKAVHAIYMMEKKKQVRIDPGSEFEIDDAEGEKLIASRAAIAVAPAKEAPAKEAPAKKAAAKKTPAKDPDPSEAVTPAAVAGSEGETGEDLLG